MDERQKYIILNGLAINNNPRIPQHEDGRLERGKPRIKETDNYSTVRDRVKVLEEALGINVVAPWKHTKRLAGIMPANER